MEPPSYPERDGATESPSECSESSFPSLEGVEKILRYTFKNKKLLEEAYTHGSCQKENNFSYERLEFMGDSVLSLLITREHFFLYPDLQPGPLTRLRSANVDKEKLARVALNHGLHRFLRHNKTRIHQQIREFGEAVKDYPLHSNGQIEVPKVLADLVESTIGAVFVDCDCSMDILWEVFKGLLEPRIVPETLKVHPVTELNERCQKKGVKLEYKDSWKRRGGIELYIDGYFAGRGEYPTRKDIALNRAAKAALNNIDQILKTIENPTLIMKLKTRWRAALKYVYG